MLSDIAGNGTAAEGGDNRKTDFLPKPFQRPNDTCDKQANAEKPAEQSVNRVFFGSFEGILLCLEQHLAAHILAHERFVIERHLVI